MSFLLATGRVLSAALLLGALAPSSAGAALIQVAFSGIVTEVVDPNGAWGSLAVGDAFSGTLTMDDAVPDQDSAFFDGYYLDIDGLFLQYALEVGSVSLVPQPEYLARVVDFTQDFFTFEAGISGPVPAGGFSLELQNSSGTVLPDDSLGGVPFDLSAWPTAHRITLSSNLDPYTVVGDIQSLQLVPEPTTALLLGAGLAGLAGVRRFRARVGPATQCA